MDTATASKPRKTKTAKPQPAAVARLTLTIAGTAYTVRFWTPEDGEYVRGLRLRKAGGDPIDVAEHRDGSAWCSCGDFEFRHADRDDFGCKHVRAARAVGLISPAKPAPLPELEPLPRRQPQPQPAQVESPAEVPTYTIKGPHCRLPIRGWIDLSMMVRTTPDPDEPGCVRGEWQSGNWRRFRGADAVALPLALAEYRRHQQEP